MEVTVRRSFVAGVAVVALCVSACSSDAEGDAASSPLSTRIELDASTVTTGEAIDGRVIVVNNTGNDMTVRGCGSIFQVALTNEEYEPQLSWDDCLEEFSVPVGESSYPVTVRAHHLSCTRGPSSGNVVPCGDHEGLPPLPPGDYETRLYERSGVMPEAPPVDVRVLSGS